MKQQADLILKQTAEATTSPNALRWLIQTNIYKEEAETRIAEILEGDEEDRGPTPLQFEIAKTVVTLLLDPKEQEDLQRTETERWLVK